MTTDPIANDPKLLGPKLWRRRRQQNNGLNDLQLCHRWRVIKYCSMWQMFLCGIIYHQSICRPNIIAYTCSSFAHKIRPPDQLFIINFTKCAIEGSHFLGIYRVVSKMGVKACSQHINWIEPNSSVNRRIRIQCRAQTHLVQRRGQGGLGRAKPSQPLKLAPSPQTRRA